MVKKIKKILVANRGEIAVRIMRTCRDMDIATVAVYSDPDRCALHVRYANEAYYIGKAQSKQSYLNIDKIIDVAKKSKADAIHPGYGFLSENPNFAQAISDAGLIFIGAPVKSMQYMASKIAAREIMSKAQVPVVPGLNSAALSHEDTLNYCRSIGFPVMIKASFGGGGKGMRKVKREDNFISLFSQAASEARNSFGNDDIYVEKFLDKPRHIEVQVIADQHGQCFHILERECSVQRRHQKLIEEAPSCFIDDEMRQKMGQIACKAAQAVDYLGLGTVEFLVDSKKNFYFMEMNTRLQVEHPITEMITGLDLIKHQIEVAQGEKLEFIQEKIKPQGWAIEARVCAEDADNNFMPTPGTITNFTQPGGAFVRTDTGVYAGFEITQDYDPMIAKIIAWGDDRNTAIKRLDRALSEFSIGGITTNTAFLRQILTCDSFTSGIYDTSIIENYLANCTKQDSERHKLVALIGAAIYSFEKEQKMKAKVKSPHILDKQQSISNWRQAINQLYLPKN